MSAQQSASAGETPGAARAEARDANDVLDLLADEGIDTLRLQFVDVAGTLRHVDVPARQFRHAVDGDLVLDGSSMGFVRLDEADMLLRPDVGSFAVLPWTQGTSRVARLICDIYRADSTGFEGDPRGVLRRVVSDAAEVGFQCSVGMEVEFYLFEARAGSARSARAYRPAGDGESVRQEIVEALEAMGIAVASAHPEASNGQHEIDLRASDALRAADHLATLRMVARTIARRHGVRASFMPKPVYGQHGSGLHIHHSLLRDGVNAFADPEEMDGLSAVLRGYVGGILQHARSFAAITNPLVNSYKRLVPGYSAPLHATWSLQGGTPLVRVPAARPRRSGCEVRLADPAGNPYLALAVQVAAGLDGIRRELDPGAPVGSKVAALSPRELQRRGIAAMPQHLGEALQALEENRLVRSALGEYVYSHFVEAKHAEWEEYVAQVHGWERQRYFDV